MRSANMFLGALGVERAVMEDCVFEPQPTGQLAAVVRVRPTKKEQGRCAVCAHRCPGYDRGDGVRRWRAMDLGMCMTWVGGRGATRALSSSRRGGAAGAVGARGLGLRVCLRAAVCVAGRAH